MVAGGSSTERRRHERFPVEFPLNYKIGRKTLMGNALNVCSEGILVESYLSSRAALEMIKLLKKRPHDRLGVEFTYEGNRDVRDVEIKHFHLHFSGSEAYRLTVGFWLPRTSLGGSQRD
jgi:hypothetical protein